MGHLNIVNNETIDKIFETGFISTRGKIKTQSIKTISDLFSDTLATRIGDLIFPWIIKGKNNEKLGFKHILKIAGPPIYVRGEEYPIKIPIEKKVSYYENSLSEANALDLFRIKLLWNAIGKKSLGRGRSLTHQTQFEDDLLLSLLKKENNANNYNERIIEGITYENSYPISINLNQNNWDNHFVDDLDRVDEYKRISQLDLSLIPWSCKGYFSYEKTFEAWLMENIDKEICASLWDLIDVHNPKIVWFGNYLPFGVAGSNIDAVCILEIEDALKVIIFELKNKKLNLKDYDNVSDQVFNYAKFIGRAITSYGILKNLEIIPIILSPNSGDFPKNKINVKDGILIRWFGYYIENGNVIFNDHLII